MFARKFCCFQSKSRTFSVLILINETKKEILLLIVLSIEKLGDMVAVTGEVYLQLVSAAQ